ncbi:MAG: molybdenum cofactor guanylyltransferase [Acidimicrobiales bacterium]
MSTVADPTIWDGAILCGGRSRRMGRDKALLVVAGEPMVLRVARALHGAGASRIVAVGGDQAGIAAALEPLAADPTNAGVSGAAGAEPASAHGPPDTETRPEVVATVPDQTPDAGPLGGILTALAATASPVVLVVACDLMAPSVVAMATTVGTLVAHPAADLAAPVVGSQTEWLHTAWQRRAQHPLAARFAAGERAIHRAVAAAALTVLAVPGLDPAVLADADTPTDLY